MKDITNEITTDKDAKTKTQPRTPRERRERGPPADGIPSKTKVMVANLPYDLTEEKVCPLCVGLLGALLTSGTAQGTLLSLRTIFRQDRPPTDSPIHDQEAPGPW